MRKTTLRGCMERGKSPERKKPSQLLAFVSIPAQVLSKWLKWFSQIFQAPTMIVWRTMESRCEPEPRSKTYNPFNHPRHIQPFELLHLHPSHHSIKTSCPHCALPKLLNHKLVNTIAWLLFYAIEYWGGLLLSSPIPENDWILKLRFYLNINLKRVAWALGPGRGYKLGVKRERLRTSCMSRNSTWYPILTLKA